MNITRKYIERVVDKLFTNGCGQKATRLVLVNDDAPGKPDLGGLCRDAVVNRLCDSLGVSFDEMFATFASLDDDQQRKVKRTISKMAAEGQHDRMVEHVRSNP